MSGKDQTTPEEAFVGLCCDTVSRTTGFRYPTPSAGSVAASLSGAK